MIYAVLLVLVVALAVLWLRAYVSLLAVIYHYTEKKGCPPPSEAEMKASSEYVVKRLLKR